MTTALFGLVFVAGCIGSALPIAEAAQCGTELVYCKTDGPGWCGAGKMQYGELSAEGCVAFDYRTAA